MKWVGGPSCHRMGVTYRDRKGFSLTSKDRFQRETLTLNESLFRMGIWPPSVTVWKEKVHIWARRMV